MQSKPNKRKKLALIAATAGLLLASAALAEDVWIKSENVQIRSGKGAVYPVIASAGKGAQLTVEAHEGKWLKVKVGDQDGYVFEDAVSPEKVEGGGNLLANMGAGADASNMSSGAAAKGLQPEAEDYVKDKNLNPAALNKLIALRKSIDPKVWEKFTTDGKVGPSAGQ